ncbi:MAG: aminotransferase class V-fold PLP-dependent enzyme [Calditrichia bacterium]
MFDLLTSVQKKEKPMEFLSASTSSSISLENIQDHIIGYYQKVPLLNGQTRQYINFDNAASTPSLKPVMDTVNEFMLWYSSIHRGTGFKSQLCSAMFDSAREIVAEFLQVDPQANAIIFVKNATEAINKLAHRLPVEKDQVILVSKMEHHSNDLPWRAVAPVIHINITKDGRLDEEDLIEKLKQYHRRVALVALTGAANVTGWVNDINRLAAICHEHHTRILIDAAQLAPHRQINMKPQNDPEHVDFLAMSAHKIYAPLGAGVLVGPKDFFDRGDPDYVGGGTVKIVGLDYVHWSEAPEKEEAGTPNTVGVIAMAKTLQTLMTLGMDKVAEHEKKLTRYILKRLKEVPNLEIYGGTDPNEVDHRLGVIAFNIHDVPHALTAAILNYEGGIGVRNGCFCAHPYVKALIGISEQEAKKVEQEILKGDYSRLPGAVRASFGVYNTMKEIDLFIETLQKIAYQTYEGNYVLDRERGEYHPRDFQLPFEDYFRL